jgi:excisionase family DNA binding protein
LEDAAAGLDHLDEGRMRLEQAWQFTESRMAEPGEPDAHVDALAASRRLADWATAAAEARPIRPPAHETALASGRRAALIMLEMIVYQTGSKLTRSRMAPVQGGKPNGPWLRVLQALFAHLRRVAGRHPETKVHGQSLVLCPRDETIFEWLRAFQGNPGRRRRDQALGRPAFRLQAFPI